MEQNFIPEDTSVEAFRIQIQALGRLGPEGRLRMAFELSDNLRTLVAAGVRLRHPDYDRGKLRIAVMRLMAGEDAFRKLFPNVEIKP